MSTIDELNRLHEAATTPPFCGGHGNGGMIQSPTKAAAKVGKKCPECEAVAAVRFSRDCQLREAWPAIHRVLVAARDVAGNTADDIDSRLRYVEVRPGRDEWRELVEALRALDGHQG